VTLLWFIVWLVADLVGDKESLIFAPPNAWTATLILAIALDLNRPPIAGRKTRVDGPVVAETTFGGSSRERRDEEPEG
jgi:hypothetical protein